MRYFAQTVSQVLNHFNVNAEDGLDSHAVESLQTRYGKNVLPEKQQETLFSLIFNQFKNPLIPLLFVAMVITFVLQEEIDGYVILITILINVVLGTFQEYKAQVAIASLRELSAPEAQVYRDGEIRVIPAAELVPGDILRLEEGAVVAADARIIVEQELEVDESALTGESQAVSKRVEPVEEDAIVNDQIDMVFAGTNVVRGGGRAVVTATGEETQIGTIASDVANTETEQTPLQKSLQQLSRRLVYIVLSVSVVFFVLGVITGQDPFDMFLLTIALAVSVIPEGLVIAVTIALAIGMYRMAKRNAIIRALPAVEALGSVTVIATDKTGTLTQNKLSVQSVVANNLHLDGNQALAAESNQWHRLLQVVAMANTAELSEKESVGDPVEIALLEWLQHRGLHKSAIEQEYQVVDELPFSSDYQMMGVIVEGRGEKVLLLKGSPDQILQHTTYESIEGNAVPLKGESAQRANTAVQDMARNGLKPLSFAYKILPPEVNTITVETIPRDMVLAGTLGLADTIRSEAADSVARIQHAGVRVMMLTGDHRLTAQTIAREVGIKNADNVLQGVEIDNLDDESLIARLEHTNVFARVTPRHKFRLVGLLQQQGEVVAMTGDGVNDAPALVKSDVGISMGKGGTEVARTASDIVLTDNAFATIVAAIEEGRSIFENLRKVVLYLLSTNAAEVFLMVSVVLLRLFIPDFPLPLYPTQILWLNLVTDGLPNTALIFEPKSARLLNRPPRNKDAFILDAELFKRMAVTGATMSVVGLAIFLVYYQNHGVAYARTMVLVNVAFAQLFNALNVKSFTESIFSIDLFNNKFLLYAIVGSGLLQFAVVGIPVLAGLFRTVPINALDWIIAIVTASAVVGADELWKRYLRSGRE